MFVTAVCFLFLTIIELFYSRILMMNWKVLFEFIQEVSGVYTSPSLDTDEPKMALRARNVSGTYEKQASGPKKCSVLVERKASCRVANAFLSRLEFIWLKFRQKISKCPKNAFFVGKKTPGVDALNNFLEIWIVV